MDVAGEPLSFPAGGLNLHDVLALLLDLGGKPGQVADSAKVLSSSPAVTSRSASRSALCLPGRA